MVFLLLSLSSFLNSFSPSLLTRHNTVFSPSPHPFSMPSCLSTPRLESAKARIVRDQKIRTDRKVEALLRPRQTRQDTELSYNSEEDNTSRLSARRARAQATQTDKSNSSFCCGFFVGLCVVLLLLFCLVLLIRNGDKRLAK